MDRLRLGSFSKGDNLTRRSMSHVLTGPPTVPEAPTESGHNILPPQAPRCVIVQRDERGYGLTVLGDNPVFVQEVTSGGAAARAGVQEGDRILKVNGTLVTSANHQEVVQMIRSGTYVALTLIGPSPGQHPPAQQRPFPALSRGTSFIQGSLTPNQTKSAKRDDGRTDRITAPQPVDADIKAQCNNTTLQTYQKMLSESLRQKQQLQLKLAADTSDPNLRSDLDNLQRTIDKLRKQMEQMRQAGSKIATTPPPLGSREATPDIAKQPPRRTKSGTQAKMASSASMENITASGITPPSLSTPPRGHLLGNHQRQRSSPDSLIYRSPNEEVQWPISPTSDILAKPPTGESADVGGAPNEAFEFDDDDSSPLLQQQQQCGLTKPMANRPLPPLPSLHGLGQDTSESRGSFEHQDSTESDAGICLFSVDQAPSAYDEPNAVVGLGESLLKGWKMLRQPIEVAMFLHYLLQNNINPAPFLFFVIVEQYKSGKPQDMCKWAYEITSTFLAPNAPLCIDPALEDGVLQTIDAYMKLVDENLQVNESELRDIFGRARMTATSHLSPQLEDFQREIESKTVEYSQCMIDATAGDSTTDIIKHWETILLNLCRSLFPLQDQVDSLGNQKSAMLSAIATVLKLTVVKSEAGLKSLEHIPTFVSKEKSRLKLFPQRSKKPVILSTLGHTFQGQHYNRVTHCSVCQDILWGVGDQGLQCSNCEMNIHKQCFKSVDENCIGEGTRAGKKPARRPTNMFRSHDNDSATDLDKLSGGSGGSPLSAAKPVVRSESFRQRRENRNSYRKRSDPNIPRSKSDVADDRPNVGKTAYSDSDMDCEDELPKWADLVDFETVRLMKPKEKKRQDVLNELFHTERLHVRKLKILNSVYYKPLIKMLDQVLLDKLFPNLQQLINIHSELNVKMKTKRKEESIIGNVGKVMLDFFTGEGGTNLEIAIATFCKDQTTALEELKAKQKKDPKLQQFLAEASMKKECAKLHLKEIIATSHQRLTKYPMLLDQVLKYTQPGEEYDQIFLARENSKRILAKVNRTIGEIANKNRVRDVEKHLEVWPPKDKDAGNERFKDGGNEKSKDEKKARAAQEKHIVHPLFSDPALTKHTLIHEGVLEWRLTKQKTIDITAMLFDDFLILLQKQDDKYHLRYHHIFHSEDNKVSSSLPPVINVPRQNSKDEIAIRDVATNKMGFFLVMVKQSYIYEFVAKSVSDKNKWLDKIQNIDKYLQEEDTELPLIATPSTSSTAEDAKDASKPIIRRPEEDRVYQILKEDSLLEFKAAVTVEPPVTQSLETAQQVATLPAQLQKIDEEIFRLLDEKHALVAEMMGVPNDQQLQAAEIADKSQSQATHDEHTGRDPLGLIVNLISSTRELQTLINEALKAPATVAAVTAEHVTDTPPDNQRMFPGTCCANAPPLKPSIPAHEALSICRRLNASCMALSQVVGMFDTKGIFGSTTETDSISIAGHVDQLKSVMDNSSVVDNSDTDPVYVNLNPNNNPEAIDASVTAAAAAATADDNSNNNAAAAEVAE